MEQSHAGASHDNHLGQAAKLSSCYYLIAGFVARGSVVMATVASVLVVGAMMIVAGVAQVFNAFQIKSWGKFLIWALLGVLYIVAGFVTFENPIFGAVFLTLILGASLVASGIVRIVLAFNMKAESPWIWVAVSAVITLLLGLLILARWPISSVYVLGVFLGVDLVMAGISWIGVGFGLAACSVSVTPPKRDGYRRSPSCPPDFLLFRRRARTALVQKPRTAHVQKRSCRVARERLAWPSDDTEIIRLEHRQEDNEGQCSDRKGQDAQNFFHIGSYVFSSWLREGASADNAACKAGASGCS